MSTTLTLLRWLLVLPLACVGVVSGYAVVVGLLVVAIKLCPAGQTVSGMCVAPWFSYAELGAYCVASATGTALTVLLPALAAPSNRANVALFAYITGLLFIYLLDWGRGASMMLPFAIAVLIGGSLVYLIRRRNASSIKA
jgi:hypothetical protein